MPDLLAHETTSLDVQLGVRDEDGEEIPKAFVVRQPDAEITADEVAAMLTDASSVVIVPGYGMAVAQAQHKIWELTQALLELQERERTRLGQTLHDDLGQYLSGIRAQACLLKVIADRPQQVQDTARD